MISLVVVVTIQTVVVADVNGGVMAVYGDDTEVNGGVPCTLPGITSRLNERLMGVDENVSVLASEILKS